MTPDALAALHHACFSVPRPWSSNEFKVLLEQSGVFIKVRTHGFALGRVVVDEVELLTLAVHPDHRRTGAGRALMQIFHRSAAQRGAAQSFLEVAASNSGAIALYRAEGYIETGRRPGYYESTGGGREDALILARAL